MPRIRIRRSSEKCAVERDFVVKFRAADSPRGAASCANGNFHFHHFVRAVVDFKYLLPSLVEIEHPPSRDTFNTLRPRRGDIVMARIREMYTGDTRGLRAYRMHTTRWIRVCTCVCTSPLIILYTEVSYTHPSGGMRNATVDNDNRTRDDNDVDDDDDDDHGSGGAPLFFYDTREHQMWRG